MYTKNLNHANIFMKFFRFSDFQVLFGLFRTTQDTIFGIFIVETLPTLGVLRSKIEVDIEIEHQHLTIVLHNGCIGSRGNGRQVFGDGSGNVRREWINHHNTETEMLRIIIDTYIVRQFAEDQRFAP